jgi:hypothetical protein
MESEYSDFFIDGYDLDEAAPGSDPLVGDDLANLSALLLFAEMSLGRLGSNLCRVSYTLVRKK